MHLPGALILHRHQPVQPGSHSVAVLSDVLSVIQHMLHRHPRFAAVADLQQTESHLLSADILSAGFRQQPALAAPSMRPPADHF